MKYLVFSLLILSQIVSCKSDDVTVTDVSSTENVDVLHEQFNGKYKIVSSTSSEPLDINLDGISSSDLLEEIDELQSGAVTSLHVIIISINGPSSQNPKPSFTFVQWWPEQFIRTGPGKIWDGGEMITFNPEYSVGYDMKGAFRKIEFSTDLSTLNIIPNDSEEGFLFKRPDSVTTQGEGRLKVINTRRIYTHSGVKEVTVTTIYERFTMRN